MQLFRLIEPYFSHGDARGSITGILQEGEWREVNLIQSEAGAVRGKHYHQYTQECFIILEGEIRVELSLRGDSEVQHEVLNASKGDVFIVPPGIEHTFHIVETARWINLLSIPLDPDAPDLHRYSDG